MRVRFFGTRGSIPTPGPRTIRYGGNTSCVEVRSDGGTLLLIDIGTGAFGLGLELTGPGLPVDGHVLISHTHWDHIQGLPFFAPFFETGNEWDIYAPRGLGQSLRDTLSGQMQYTYFPVTLEQLGATIHYHDLVEGGLTVGDIQVEARYLNHPALTLGYRLKGDGVIVVYACDHEPYSAGLAAGTGGLVGEDRRHAEFLADADLVIHDAQYVASEYPDKAGWGHSTIEYAVMVAQAARAKRLALTHHDPLRGDDEIDALIAHYRPLAASSPSPLELFAAAEGQAFELSGPPTTPDANDVPARPAALPPALVGHSVMVAMDDTRQAEEIMKMLGADDVAVLTAQISAISTAVKRDRPSMLVLEDSGEADRIEAICSAVRGLGPYGRELPIILITGNGDRRLAEALGVSEQLVAPFSKSYARTRLRAWLMRTACRWERAPIPANEAERLASLHRLALLDTPPEDRFDRITRLAASTLDAPMAAMTLVDRDRQWFKSTYGLAVKETPRDESFCAHVVFDPVPMVVPDARLDPRFADNPEVAGAPFVRFYAGHPLVLSDGYCVGTLCIVDTRPRELDYADLDQLKYLAGKVTEEIERRP
jgi:phosphoribosyl 1,2-cyclic phosphodiesterase